MESKKSKKEVVYVKKNKQVIPTKQNEAGPTLIKSILETTEKYFKNENRENIC